jgi:DNA-binding HxlR family transcriptional regulator
MKDTVSNCPIEEAMQVLSGRKLEEAGIVHRTVFDGYPLRVEYDLTPFGLELVPLIDALGDWWERRKSIAAEVEPRRLLSA